ncbi:carboxypeptidase-like regulatory domain-containing protein [Flavobacterium sp.]|uniref:carboxypeptidase-like regulatory domain-containing protein n=1 Tax=Flavobacterium sp. TaxID=239 RepID=UPI003BE274C0
MKKLVICLLFVMQVCFVFAQAGTGFSGKIVDSKSQKPLQNVVVSVQNSNLTQISDAQGKFTFTNATEGSQLVLVKSVGYKEQLLTIDVVKDKVLDLGVVVLEEDIAQDQIRDVLNIQETDLGDEGNSSESTTSLLQSSRDAFLQAAAYNFGQARFSVRGIDNEYSNVMINGISMNRVGDGRPQYGDWGGLNDATRNQEFTNGSAPSDYVFGGIAGTQEINTRASIYRPGTRISFLNTNTNYSFRTMGTFASGINKDGWAYVVSASRRWAQEGYFEGTNYSANSLFASVEKKINDKHSLNFTSIYAQNKRGKNSPNTDEQNDLVGNKYNSYWGYQDGRRRNSRMKKTEEPLLMLTHYWKVNSKTNINTSVSYQIGEIGNSRLDYTKDNNPDPTYYTKLPSYYANRFDSAGNYIGDTPQNIAFAILAKDNFIANPQLDWTKIYTTNTKSLANGSRIALYEDRNDENIATFNTNLSTKLSDNIFMNAGINYLNSSTKNFKNMLDLLGGNYYNDINTFGLTFDQEQSDLNNPLRQVKVGDKYGYNYIVDANRLDVFTQFKFTYKKIDFYLAESFSRSGYQRNGLYKNGYYPTNSFGKSDKVTFDNFGFKGGLTYKISGRQYLDFNGIYMSKAPNTKDVFSNARVNNTIARVTNETIRGVDASYIIKAPKFKARFTGYFSETLNSTDINFYYADGLGGVNQFVSEVVTGINKRNRGIETGLEYQLTSTIKLTGVAAYGDYTITNNPDVNLANDSSGSLISYGKSNLAGYKLSGMPQQAYSFGVEYRDPKFWWIGANVNYLSDNYLDVSVIKRTANYYAPANNDLVSLYGGIDQNLADKYLKQEKFDSFFLFNLVGGKSWRFNYKYTIGLFANVNNVLNINYKTGGFEQSRNASYQQDYQDHQSNGPSVFAPKYFYGYGRTYSVNIYLSF